MKQYIEKEHFYENEIKFFGKTYQEEVPKNVAAESDMDEMTVKNEKSEKSRKMLCSDYFTEHFNFQLSMKHTETGTLRKSISVMEG